MLQTCTEFGFYQTCPKNSGCPYTQGLHGLDTDLQICQEAFGIKPESVTAQVGDQVTPSNNFMTLHDKSVHEIELLVCLSSQVAYSNAYYGSDKPGATRILFPNGDVDPWSAMGVQHAPTKAAPTLMVSGASHHFWTHPSLPTDQAEVVEARQVIWYQVSNCSRCSKLMRRPLIER